MKIAETHDFFHVDLFQTSAALQSAWNEVQAAILATDWPHGSGKFVIRPKRRGNGVDPIKIPCVSALRDFKWQTEAFPVVSAVLTPGDLDALKQTPEGFIAFEWETGNISSSHRALNKLFYAMHEPNMLAGILVVPCSRLASFLTDRVGNIKELKPYFPLWHRFKDIAGAVRIVVIEHDAEDESVPLIPKRTDGWAVPGARRLKAKSKAKTRATAKKLKRLGKQRTLPIVTNTAAPKK